jgi:beta-1,2-mannosidase
MTVRKLLTARKRSARMYAGVAASSLAVIIGVFGVAIGHSQAWANGSDMRTDSSTARGSADRATFLPSWAIGPFSRYKHNPILTPPVVPTPTTRWEWPEVFNPGVVFVDGVFRMLYRGTDFSDVSAIGAARSTTGYHFTPVSDSPVITPALPSENQGVEDPRLYYLAGKYYSFFTGDSGATPGATIDINEAVSTNARNWTQLGPVLQNTKDAAVVANPEGRPARIDGHYLMYYGQMGHTDLAESTDFTHWTTVSAVNLKFPASYGGYEFCVAVTNYRTTAQGPVHRDIDLFVAGELMGHGRWYYAISEVEFNRSRLQTAAARVSSPVLSPRAPYEIYGHTPHTVFMNDLIFYRGQWRMYYGAADSVIALATAPLRLGS